MHFLALKPLPHTQHLIPLGQVVGRSVVSFHAPGFVDPFASKEEGSAAVFTIDIVDYFHAGLAFAASKEGV